MIYKFIALLSFLSFPVTSGEVAVRVAYRGHGFFSGYCDVEETERIHDTLLDSVACYYTEEGDRSLEGDNDKSQAPAWCEETCLGWDHGCFWPFPACVGYRRRELDHCDDIPDHLEGEAKCRKLEDAIARAFVENILTSDLSWFCKFLLGTDVDLTCMEVPDE